MANPPASGPHSDIDGVNRDARAGKASTESWPDPGAALANAKLGNKARPKRDGEDAKQE